MAGVIFANIENRRADLGVTKTRMAEKLDISEQALTNKLTGVSEFSAREARTLSKWWNTSLDVLLEKMEEVEPAIR